MRLDISTDYKKIVKIKNPINGTVFPDKQNPNLWWKECCFWRWQPFSVKLSQISENTKIEKEKLLDGFNIDSYVGVIESFLIFYKDEIVFLNNEKTIKFYSNKKRKKYAACIGAGIKFYENYIKDEKTGAVTLGKPINLTNSNSFQIIYQSKEIETIEKIRKFESIKFGDLLIMKKAKGIVIDVQEQKENTKIYNKNFWSNKKIEILGNSVNAFKKTKITADRNYKIIRPHSVNH